MINLDEDAEDGRVIALQSLSNTQLIEILQHHDGDDDVAQMVEEKLVRRRTDGASPQRPTRSAPRLVANQPAW